MIKNVLRKENALQNTYFIFNSNKAHIKQSWRFTIKYNIILNAYIFDIETESDACTDLYTTQQIKAHAEKGHRPHIYQK